MKAAGVFYAAIELRLILQSFNKLTTYVKHKCNKKQQQNFDICTLKKCDWQ